MATMKRVVTRSSFNGVTAELITITITITMIIIIILIIIDINIYIYIYVCMYVYIYIYICVRTTLTGPIGHQGVLQRENVYIYI